MITIGNALSCFKCFVLLPINSHMYMHKYFLRNNIKLPLILTKLLNLIAYICIAYVIFQLPILMKFLNCNENLKLLFP